MADLYRLWTKYWAAIALGDLVSMTTIGQAIRDWYADHQKLG